MPQVDPVEKVSYTRCSIDEISQVLQLGDGHDPSAARTVSNHMGTFKDPKIGGR